MMHITEDLVQRVGDKILSSNYYLNIKYPFIYYLRSKDLVDIIQELMPSANPTGGDITRLIRRLREYFASKGYVMLINNRKYIITHVNHVDLILNTKY
jgi:hypothetical protein